MDNLRLATKQERDFYYHSLYPLQDFVLSLLEGETDIYLTGGTALARFYFQHRLSEDIDLFIKVNIEDDIDSIDSHKRTDLFARDLAGKLARQFKIVNEQYGKIYSRFFIQADGFALKVDFVREYNHLGDLTVQPGSVNLNNLEDMGASKIAAFEDRAEIKDIVDLFYLTKQIPLSRLFELADLKRAPVPYENLLTVNTQGISGVALLEKEIALDEFRQFIDHLKIETEREVKKKEQMSQMELDELVRMTLWDFPPEFKTINPHSIPVLKRRLYRMPLPQHSSILRAEMFPAFFSKSANARSKVAFTNQEGQNPLRSALVHHPSVRVAPHSFRTA